MHFTSSPNLAPIARRTSGGRRKAAFVALCAVIAAVDTRSPSGAAAADIVPAAAVANDAAALMQRVAAAYARDVAGVVAVRSHSDLTIKAPIFGRHIVDDDWYVFADGTLVASSRKADPRQPPLHDPYRTEYLAEYAFRSATCATCAPGTTAIAYDSETRDVAHAHGTFVVEEATAHIVSGTETPYKLPWPTKSGELKATWADTPEGWFPIRVEGAFVGNIGPFVGRAFYAQSNAAIERFPTVADATASLVARAKTSPAAADAPTPRPDVANAPSDGR